jgi:hypothetical protein
MLGPADLAEKHPRKGRPPPCTTRLALVKGSPAAAGTAQALPDGARLRRQGREGKGGEGGRGLGFRP